MQPHPGGPAIQPREGLDVPARSRLLNRGPAAPPEGGRQRSPAETRTRRGSEGRRLAWSRAGEAPSRPGGPGGTRPAPGSRAQGARGAARTRHMKSRSVAVMAGWGFMEWCMTRMAGSVDEHREGRFRAGAQPHSPPFPLGRPQRRRPPKRLVVLIRPRPWHAEERQDEAAFSTADTAPGPSPGSRDKGRGSRGPPPATSLLRPGSPLGDRRTAPAAPTPRGPAVRDRPRRGRQRAGRGGRRWPVAATHLCS